MRRRLFFLYAVLPSATVAFAVACNSLQAAPISACADDEPGAALECACEQNPHDARCMEGGAPETDGSMDAIATNADAADAADVTMASDAMDASSSDDADGADDAADAAD